MTDLHIFLTVRTRKCQSAPEDSTLSNCQNLRALFSSLKHSIALSSHHKSCVCSHLIYISIYRHVSSQKSLTDKSSLTKLNPAAAGRPNRQLQRLWEERTARATTTLTRNPSQKLKSKAICSNGRLTHKSGWSRPTDFILWNITE